MAEPLSVWCVRHRDGWCATSQQYRKPPVADNVKTKCGYFVWLPWGIDRRLPDCSECLAKMENSCRS